MNKQQQASELRKLGDLILPFATMPIPAAKADIRLPIVRELPVSTLIFADAAGCSRFLAGGIAGLGRNSIIVHAPLDAIVQLENVNMAVDATFASLQDADFDISSFFDFLKDKHPRVRRIAFAQHESKNDVSALAHTCQHDMILWDPWDRVDFAETLKDALDCRVRRTRSRLV